MSILSMPEEILDLCISDLCLRDILSIRNTCKSLKKVASEVSINVNADWLYDKEKGNKILPNANVQKFKRDIDRNGITKIYVVDEDSEILHCEDGPAIYSEAGREYYKYGKIHRPRDQGPAIDYNFRNVNNTDYNFSAGYYNGITMRKKLSHNGMFSEYWENGKRIHSPIHSPIHMFSLNMSLLDREIIEQTPRGATEVDYVEEARRITKNMNIGTS